MDIEVILFHSTEAILQVNPVFLEEKVRIDSIATQPCVNPACQDIPWIDLVRQDDLQDYLNPVRHPA